MKTLIVDASDAFRGALCDTLGEAFPRMHIEQAADAQHALLQLSRQLPDLVLMDIHLPGVSGLDLTRLIKKRYCSVRVLVMTSHDLAEYRDAAHESGADGILYKGVHALEAVRIVEDALRAPPRA